MWEEVRDLGAGEIEDDFKVIHLDISSCTGEVLLTLRSQNRNHLQDIRYFTEYSQIHDIHVFRSATADSGFLNDAIFKWIWNKIVES